MSDCELLNTCPFFNNEAYGATEMTKKLKEAYCHGEFGWCGRYMTFKAMERERGKAASPKHLSKMP